MPPLDFFDHAVSPAEKLSDMATLLGVAKSLLSDPAPVSAAEGWILAGAAASHDAVLIDAVRSAIRDGHDPLGDAYCAINGPATRRKSGQTFTPDRIVAGMFAWAAQQCRTVDRLVDPGAGSGRYTLAGLRAFATARAVAVEADPKVAVLLRANLAAAGLADRAEIVVQDFRSLELPKIEGVTLWVGNPPYVRHHDIDPAWKTWYSQTLKRFGLSGSQLAGLHLHFFLKTLELASEGDLGCYVTAAEWLDVKYGQALRQLLTDGLGGTDVFVVDPEVRIFDDALVSATITCFAPRSRQGKLRFSKVATEHQLRELGHGEAVDATVAKAEPKWSVLPGGAARAEKSEDFIDLGELFRISRGQVTGLNRVWIEGAHTPALPARFLLPAITDSADITEADEHVIRDTKSLRRLVCLPRDLNALDNDEKSTVDRFLQWARMLGAHETYIARHRNPWWSVGSKEAAPIVMTYMGRRPPVFALNRARAQLINIAHGLYPRRPLTDEQMSRLVGWLNVNVSRECGRIYAGGLTKFEPSEAMRISIPKALAA